MYRSLYQLRQGLTEYQILLLLYLRRGCNIVTTEGKYYRAWMQYASEIVESVTVRKNTANNLFLNGLILPVANPSKYFHYVISPKGLQVLSVLDFATIRRIEPQVVLEDRKKVGE